MLFVLLFSHISCAKYRFLIKSIFIWGFIHSVCLIHQQSPLSLTCSLSLSVFLRTHTRTLFSRLYARYLRTSNHPPPPRPLYKCILIDIWFTNTMYAYIKSIVSLTLHSTMKMWYNYTIYEPHDEHVNKTSSDTFIVYGRRNCKCTESLCFQHLVVRRKQDGV